MILGDDCIVETTLRRLFREDQFRNKYWQIWSGWATTSLTSIFIADCYDTSINFELDRVAKVGSRVSFQRVLCNLLDLRVDGGILEFIKERLLWWWTIPVVVAQQKMKTMNTRISDSSWPEASHSSPALHDCSREQNIGTLNPHINYREDLTVREVRMSRFRNCQWVCQWPNDVWRSC